MGVRKIMNIQTKYLGMILQSPLVASASPLSQNLDNIKRLEEAGAGAVVLYSLFEEQIRHDRNLMHLNMVYGTESYAEALTAERRRPSISQLSPA
jgi:dihydroorotate dehydrogenase (fumarate)